MLSLNSDEAALLLPHIAGPLGVAPRTYEDDGEQLPPLMASGVRLGALKLGLRDVMRAILASGVRTMLITDGARGAYAANSGTLSYCPAVPAVVEGTTGAGDAFSSTFAAFASEGETPAHALRLAALNSAAVVGVVDANSGLLTRSELRARSASLEPPPPIRTWPL